MRWFLPGLLAVAAGCQPLVDPVPESPSTGSAVRAKATAAIARAEAGEPAKAAEKKPEGLPPVPQADPKSKLTALNKQNTLYLEVLPDGRKRVLVAAEVCLREGLLEVFLCKKNTKEHESILRVDMDARFIHAALVGAGAKYGKPVQFVNEKGDPDYKPASGDKIQVGLHYTLDGKPQSHAAQEWILDKKTKKPMAHQWVFAGSRFMKNPDAPPTDPDYYCANNGEVICLSNFVDSMLDLPVEISRENADLNFDALTAKIPPLGSMVWVILEPVPAAK
jgi:hypothetical protein